jgi:hypothetical protein
VPWRFFQLGELACVGAPSRGAYCGAPSPDRYYGQPDRGDAGSTMALLLRPVMGTASIVETSSDRATCFRTTEGVASCAGREPLERLLERLGFHSPQPVPHEEPAPPTPEPIAQPIGRGVSSVAGAPYLLHEDGTVSVAHALDGPEEALDALREQVISKLPPMERLVATSLATCGLTRSGQLLCWPEPAYPYDLSIQAPVPPAPAPVPGLHDVVDLALMPWLTLCARTRAGAVLCSASPPSDTQVCELRGRSNIRCGAVAPMPAPGHPALEMPPGLAGEGYDPRRVLERPLVPIPGIDGATTMSLYAHSLYMSRDAPRRLFVSELEEGGCARLGSGAVACWERDHCVSGAPWRSSTVAGLPDKPARVALGSLEGYAIDDTGGLYAWARRPGADCSEDRPFALRAERVPLAEPVVDAGGGTFRVAQRLAWLRIGCATTIPGRVLCWSSEYDRDGVLRRTPIEVTLAE